jgi:hypothetical protein
MKPWWMTLLLEQRAAKFDAISGATASLLVPISDTLITDVVRRQLSASVREFEIRAESGNQLTVSVRLHNPAWFPRINAKLHIERQPDLPDVPVLVIRLLSKGLAALAGPAARFLRALPSWLQLEGDLLRVDLAELLRQYDAVDALSYIRRAEVTTREGSIVLAIDALAP